MYSAKIDDERVQFGTSGFLYLSNKLMYDRKTNTLWRQFTGEPVVGALADSGIKLSLFPVVVTTWEEWVTAHPDTLVLDNDTGIYPPYLYLPEDDPTSFYYRYRNSPDTMFPVRRRSNVLETKAIVLGLRLEGQPKAYPLDRLVEDVLVNDDLGGTALVIVTDTKARAARVYRRGAHNFVAPPAQGDDEGSRAILDEKGNLWRVTEEALVKVNEPSQRLERLPSHMAFWFGWFAFFPLTQVYGEAEAPP